MNNKQLKNEINNLKVENNQMKLKIEEYNKEINNLKENIKLLDKSEIMKIDEKDMLYKEIENKMNKRLKKINKLYQATKDGGDPINFHLKCDNIPNTLVLIKSEGNRRFGGFTPIPWKSGGDYWIKDPENKKFIFSLDNKKIYYLKDSNKAVLHKKDSGPCFGSGHDIGNDGNPIKKNVLYTFQYSYDYKGDSNALSEYNGQNYFILRRRFKGVAMKLMSYKSIQFLIFTFKSCNAKGLACSNSIGFGSFILIIFVIKFPFS